MSVIKLSALLDHDVVDEHGTRLGRIRDVRVRRTGDGYEVEGILVGKRGMLARLGIGDEGEAGPTTLRDAIPWSDVVRVEDGRVTIRAQG